MKKRDKILLIVGIILAVVLFTAGSYAFWIWNSNVDKNVVFNTMGDVSKYVVYDEGNSYMIGNFQPKNTFCESVNTTISFYKKEGLADVELNASIKLSVNKIGSAISSSSDVYWVVTEGDNSITCSNGLNSPGVIAYGTFNNKTAGETIEMANVDIPLSEQKYTIWIWIDSAGTNISNLSGATIDTNVWTEISMISDISVNFDANGGEFSTIYKEILYESESGKYSLLIPENGVYKLEAWGASGGGTNAGKGGYTSGLIELKKDTDLHIYVGGKGAENASITNIGGYNGGGYSGNNAGTNSYGGGGATDFRLSGGEWNNDGSLKSRIMVAAGGAGTSAGVTTIAGSGGGLIGGNGTSSDSLYNNSSYLPIGSNQTSVGFTYQTTARQGGFGYAIQSNTSGWGGGGGGGYWGGSNGHGTTGSGGSSYISGHTGSVAIISNGSTSPRLGTNGSTCVTGSTDNLCSIHYSGNKFTDTIMIDGNGYNWTNVKGELRSMPNPAGGNYLNGSGHTGSGVAKVYKLINGGQKKLSYGEVYGELPIPTKENYTFNGWNTELDGSGDFVTDETIVNMRLSHTLYAQWIAN